MALLLNRAIFFMSVTTLHPQYNDFIPVWQRVRDASTGQRAIKARPQDTQSSANFVCRYLPQNNPPDPKRYKLVLQIARYFNMTGHTVDKLIGAAFNTPPIVELPSSIAYLEDDIDGQGNNIDQLAKEVCRNTTIAGRHVLLVDYPQSPGSHVTAEEVTALDLKPSIKQYVAESVPNWDDSTGMLTFVVLAEAVRTSDNMFEHESEVSRRIYYISRDKNEDGKEIGEMKCRVQIVKNEGQFNDGEGDEIKNASGVTLDYIPIVFVGAESNTADVDAPPIEGMADTNIAHFQADAWHRENLKTHGQITLGVSTSHTVDDFKKANPNGIQIGANKGVNLGDKGGFYTATAPESAALPAALLDLKADMVAIGASLIDRGSGPKTAKEAGIEAKSQTSIMQNVVLNSSDAITWCLKVCEQFAANVSSDGISYEISTEFFDSVIEPQMIMALLGAVDREVITKQEARDIISLGVEGIDDPDGVTKAEERTI
jgi:hypothetical protein